ncbi:hypothetical protein HPT27_11475 [Permianibacter sp. IMCC34836]|uniref:hypothetical protein n=1 Tax=Permianibacter fluminis TaxID=2738515 RepID=UPI001551BB40|nr:hypothetical protein [Permianibacter fluminis]NQD37646.1 hypothetical protein [Permianibacter fluminis]
MRRYRHYLLFALLTYLWCATGLDRLASLQSVMSNEPADAVVVATEQARQLVVHHVGHQDVHEPGTLDLADADADSSHGHGDHVVPYCDDDANQATPAKETKFNKLSPLALPAPVALAFAHLSSFTSSPSPEPVQRRASAEFTRTVRLLI